LGSSRRRLIQDISDDTYRIRYTAPADSLLRIAVPYAPRWTAVVDRLPVKVLPLDYALCGVILPAGQHELTFQYRPLTFGLGAAGALAVILMLAIPSKSSRSNR